MAENERISWTYPGPQELRVRWSRKRELLLAAWAGGVLFFLLVAENQGGPLGGVRIIPSLFAISVEGLIFATICIATVRPLTRVTGLGTSSKGVCIETRKGLSVVPWEKIVRLWWGPMDPEVAYSDYRWNLSWTREGETWWGLRKTFGSIVRLDEHSVVLMIPRWASNFPKEIERRPECPKSVLDEGSSGKLRASGLPLAF